MVYGITISHFIKKVFDTIEVGIVVEALVFMDVSFALYLMESSLIWIIKADWHG